MLFWQVYFVNYFRNGPIKHSSTACQTDDTKPLTTPKEKPRKPKKEKEKKKHISLEEKVSSDWSIV